MKNILADNEEIITANENQYFDVGQKGKPKTTFNIQNSFL
jgi:hypothetical protein